MEGRLIAKGCITSWSGFNYCPTSCGSPLSLIHACWGEAHLLLILPRNAVAFSKGNRMAWRLRVLVGF